MNGDEITFTIVGDPIPKGRPRNYGGRTVTPKRTRDEEARIRTLAADLVAAPFDEPVRVSLVYYCATRRRTDLDNLMKLTCDALNGVAFTDDHLVHSLRGRLHRRALDETPRTEVRIEALRPAKDTAA